MNIIIIGAQGVGKGTVSEALAKKYNFVHLSTGDILRDNIKRKTKLGKTAQPYVLKGKLIPDKIIIDMMLHRIKKPDCKKHGYILDGFPRNLKQAKALKNTKIDLVLHLTATKKTIIQRISGRRICEKCKSIYHTTNFPPKKPGICDKCGSKLYQRKDETPEAIKTRLKLYHQKTEPLLKLYKKQNLLKEISTETDLKTIIKNSIKALNQISA